ncbi:TilS substrate-binding domain-containing protein [Streptosporangium algeriense]|uniref:TilS substrate-binding domain-containing protein n=1 Tax=Streptosporangium algeriense TaxID=1682748 RepID=A0ABW3DR87_9ACTN
MDPGTEPGSERVGEYDAQETGGSAPGTLAAAHVLQVDRLVTAWRGQRRVEVPGGIGVVRRYGTLVFARHPASPIS